MKAKLEFNKKELEILLELLFDRQKLLYNSMGGGNELEEITSMTWRIRYAIDEINRIKKEENLSKVQNGEMNIVDYISTLIT